MNLLFQGSLSLSEDSDITVFVHTGLFTSAQSFNMAVHAQREILEV